MYLCLLSEAAGFGAVTIHTRVQMTEVCTCTALTDAQQQVNRCPVWIGFTTVSTHLVVGVFS